MNDQPCKRSDLQYAGEAYLYAPVMDDGEPESVNLDVDDAREAIQMASEFFYTCRGCGDEWHDFDEALAHLEES